MKVGVPTEIKTDEYRVALTPSGVRELVEHGHEVVVQAGAGEGSAIADADYDRLAPFTWPAPSDETGSAGRRASLGKGIATAAGSCASLTWSSTQGIRFFSSALLQSEANVFIPVRIAR